MTTFNDFLSDKYVYNIQNVWVKYSDWLDKLWRDQLADYLTQYIAEISSSTMSMSKVAECLIDNQ